MEIELEEVEKEEVKRRKKNRKKYLYALGVLVVAGLFLGSATHIPIGVQFVTPALSSVSYFFGGGHGIAQWIYYWHWGGEDVWHAFVHAVMSVGLGIILDYIGAAPIITGVDDILAAGTEAVVAYLATIFAAYLPWWLGPAVLPYITAIAVL